MSTWPTYRHNQVPHCLTTELTKFFSEVDSVSVYADLLGMRVSDSPQAMIPPSIMVTLYHPDIVLYNKRSNSVALLEPAHVPWIRLIILTLPGIENKERRSTKSCSPSLIVWEFFVFMVLLNWPHFPASLTSFMNCATFVQDKIMISKSIFRRVFDLAASISKDEFSWQGIFISFKFY